MSNLFGKCNCGRDMKYSHFKDGVEVGSCNKHVVCRTYAELEDGIRLLNLTIGGLQKDKDHLTATIKQMLSLMETIPKGL